MATRYCVIPAAGLGTRFLPVTKALPKELLPVLDRPVIEWAVEEAVAAGATDVVLVLAEGKDEVADHLRPAPELERLLQARGKTEKLAAVRRSGSLARVTVATQADPHGLGDAVLAAEGAVPREPFLCMLPDDLSIAERPILAQLWDAHQRFGTTVLALMRVPGAEIARYGVAEVDESHGRLHRVVGLVEKPRAEEAKSDLAVMGRYVLTPDVFDSLRATRPGALGEVQLTDGIAGLLQRGGVWGVEFEGELLDVGTPRGWLATNVRLAARDRELAGVLRAALEAVPA